MRGVGAGNVRAMYQRNAAEALDWQSKAREVKRGHASAGIGDAREVEPTEGSPKGALSLRSLASVVRTGRDCGMYGV